MSDGFDPSETPTQPWASSAAGLDFLEAVFRYQFENNPLKPEAFEHADFVFLALWESRRLIDPPAALMARFADCPTVEPVSSADTSRPLGVKHKEKEGLCILFVIENLINDSTAYVGIVYKNGCDAGHAYRFELQDGEWVMTAGGMTWQS